MRTERRFRTGGWMLVLTLLATGLVPGSVLGQDARHVDPFDHDTHAGLFPVCTGCHTGVPEGDRASFFPDPSACTNCHDGEDLVRVSWMRIAPEGSNLRFRHDRHFADAADAGEDMTCRTCHQTPDSPRMRDVHRAQASQCISCHVHEATSHLEDASCTTCHVPLAESGYSTERILDIPVPPDHEKGPFLAQVHGEMASGDLNRCATCHTQDRCSSCHVDAATVAEIQAMPPAPTDMILPVSAVHYSVPETHGSYQWMDAHGFTAGYANCATCHTRNDCTACHVSPIPELMQEFPARGQVPAPGVGLGRSAPESHWTEGFLTGHAPLAASDESYCATCHTQESCIACHDAPTAPSYHPQNFALQHAAAAYGRTMECQTCHSQEEFCRSCHVQQGLNSRGRLGPGYHDGQGVWLFQHGLAARQQLESCVSCHTQNECMQCHSLKGAFKINPHGPDFDAKLAQSKNAQICLACHLTPPLGGGGGGK